MQEYIDLRRVEDGIGAGFPDVDGFALFIRDDDGPDIPFGFKIELKSKERPARPETPIRFPLEKRRAQIEFMRRRYQMGEAAYFLLQVGSGPDRMIYLAPGDAGERLRDGMTEAGIAVLCATENGMVFDKSTKPEAIVKGIWKCSKRR